MLVTIVVLFVVCWGPSLVDNVLVSFGVLDRLHYGHLKYIRQAFALASYANSCVNPIVYAFLSKNFRQGFRATLCACVDAGGSGGDRGTRRGAGFGRVTLMYTSRGGGDGGGAGGDGGGSVATGISGCYSDTASRFTAVGSVGAELCDVGSGPSCAVIFDAGGSRSAAGRQRVNGGGGDAAIVGDKIN